MHIWKEYWILDTMKLYTTYIKTMCLNALVENIGYEFLDKW